MTDQDKQTIEQSKDPRELKRTATDIAAGASEADLRFLGRHLSTSGFLDRLDTAESYEGTYTGLRLARVVNALMDNRRPATDAVLLGLISAPEYQAEILRMQLLVHALAVIQPSPPQAIAYWDRVSKPQSPLYFDMIEALCVNQSAPAMQLLEAKFADAGHAPDLKITCMHRLILVRRNDEPILLCCERMLKQSMPQKNLQLALVQTLFDYRADEWYRGCDPPKPPLRVLASKKAKAAIQRIAEHALSTMALEPVLKLKVEAVLKEVRQ